jgi:hypothetical protein
MRAFQIQHRRLAPFGRKPAYRDASLRRPSIPHSAGFFTSRPTGPPIS